MKKNIILPLILLLSSNFWSCNPKIIQDTIPTTPTIKTGLDVLFEKHLDMILDKNLAIVTNQSGLNRDGKSNISMFLENDEIRLVKIFTPEHGFTGNLPAGEKVEYDSVIKNLPEIVSLYGKNRKPTKEMLKNFGLIIYDIQDVGARFYTYISTLGFVMESAVEFDIPVMVLDRPNPIGQKTDGPILDLEHKSFIGMYPIPTQYGMTIGELAQMMVGENFIDGVLDLEVIPMQGYYRSMYFDETNLPWIKPSPNIPDLETAIIYPGFCLFEATNVSEGRGTYSPFKQFGAPWIDAKKLVNLIYSQNLQGVEFKPTAFTPISIPSMSKYPKHENVKCNGIEIIVTNRDEYKSILTGITFLWAINKLYPDSLNIKKSSLDRIWGSDILYEQLLNGDLPAQIIDSYQNDLDEFLKIRDKYLIYN